MIKYIKNIKDLNVYVKEMTWILCKPLIIMEFVFTPFIFYYLIISIFVDKEALINGLSMLGIFIVFLLKIFKTLILCRKNLKIYFKYTNYRGEIEFTIFKEEDTYVIENIITKISDRIKKDEIKFVTKSKNCIFIKTLNNQIFFFPKTSPLISLFFNQDG